MKALYLCAVLLIATPAQAGAGRFYCEGNVGPITVDWGDKQNTVWFDDKVKDRKVGTFPTRQRYIQIREPAIWVDTKGYKTGPDGKSYSVTLDGKPCDMRGYDH